MAIHGTVLELVYGTHLKCVGRKPMWVRLPPVLPIYRKDFMRTIAKDCVGIVMNTVDADDLPSYETKAIPAGAVVREAGIELKDNHWYWGPDTGRKCGLVAIFVGDDICIISANELEFGYASQFSSIKN